MKNRYFFYSNCTEHFSLQAGDYCHIIHFCIFQDVDRIIPDENWKRSRIVMFNDIADLIFGLGQTPKCGGMTPVNETPSPFLII
jgi:hypothetical protein